MAQQQSQRTVNHHLNSSSSLTNNANASFIKNIAGLILIIISTIVLWEQIRNPSSMNCSGVVVKSEKKLKHSKSDSSNPGTASSSSSFFDKATTTIYKTILHSKERKQKPIAVGDEYNNDEEGYDGDMTTMVYSTTKRTPPVTFSLKTWNDRTDGGLTDQDRTLLAKYYGEANSVFEYGLGESTYLANYLRVPRYAGIDSSIEWVDMVKKNVSKDFRFYFADIGETIAWGVPADPTLPKTVWQYQLAPLQSELRPFDVYMVDGRWRTPCVLASFLHASSRGAHPSDTIVLLHDCVQPSYSRGQVLEPTRKNYTANDDILELVDHSRARLCVYKRKETTTDAMIFERYMKYKNDAN